MTNLIAKVAELRELAGRRQAILNRQTESVNHALLELLEIESDLLNAAPRLLAALGKVQAGDAHKLDEIIEMIDFSIPSELMSVEESDEDFDIAPSEYQEMIQMKATLQRYADLARLMEDEYAT